MELYREFLKSKEITNISTGIDVDKNNINAKLFDWQKDIVKWALKKGRSALFEDCGLGKTPQQLEWARQIHMHTGGNILILAPLAVSKQTKREGEKFDIEVNICRTQDDVKPGINITNYEMLSHFNPDEFIGVVLDESSILKNFAGKIRNEIIGAFQSTPYKLSCTATPSPNDYMELGSQSEFLGVMTRSEMLATFFVHDGSDTAKWRLKGHAEDKFWEWLASWSVVMSTPSDLGYEDGKFKLPDKTLHEIIVNVEPEDMVGQISLLPTVAQTLNERRQARRSSLKARVKAASELVNQSDEQWLVWCDLNDESSELTKSINGSVEVRGTDTNDHKENSMLDFAQGEIKALVTKPSIAGYGMNWQNCRNMIFVGLSDSYEMLYQAIRRCWRFGQERPVNVYMVISEQEGAVKANIERKEKEFEHMFSEMVKYTKDILSKEVHGTKRMVEHYNPTKKMIIPEWLRSEIA
jgi:SNF2 family DNA or RNA helicase